MNVLVVGGINNPKNRGTLSILFPLVETLGKHFQNLQITVLSTYVEMRRELVGANVQEGLFLQKSGQSADYVLSKELMSFLLALTVFVSRNLLKIDAKSLIGREKMKTVEAIEQADLIIVCGADMISDYYGFLAFAIVSIPVFLGFLLKKPIIVVASQVGPFSRGVLGRFAKLVSKIALENARFITVRDNESLDELKRIRLSNPNVWLAADSAFLLEPLPTALGAQLLRNEGVEIDTRPLVGINVNATLLSSLQGDQYRKIVTEAVKYLITDIDATVVFVPHVFGPNQSEDDRVAARSICNEVRDRKVKVLTGEYSPSELKTIIGQFDLFVSSRMHPLIHSLSMNVPSVAIDYTFKMMAIMEIFRQSRFTCHIRTLNRDDLVSKLDLALSMKSEIRKELYKRSKIVQNLSMLTIRAMEKYLLQEKRYETMKPSQTV